MTDPVPDTAEVRRDPTAWEPRTVYVRLSARRFFDNHGPLGLSQVNEQPQMPDGGHATRLVAIDPASLPASTDASLSPEPGGRLGEEDDAFVAEWRQWVDFTLAKKPEVERLVAVGPLLDNGPAEVALGLIRAAEGFNQALDLIARLSASPAPLPDDEEPTSARLAALRRTRRPLPGGDG